MQNNKKLSVCLCWNNKLWLILDTYMGMKANYMVPTANCCTYCISDASIMLYIH